jgi:hypothetical protein
MTDAARLRSLLIKAREMTQRSLDEIDDALRIADELHDAEIDRLVARSVSPARWQDYIPAATKATAS